MRYSFIPVAFAALAVASPVPQALDWDAIDALAPIPTPVIPIVDVAAQATTIAYTASLAASTVSADIAVSGLSDAEKRSVEKRDDSQTPEAFLVNDEYVTAANNAPTPKGYTQVFRNLQASNNAYGYLGYTALTSYNVESCASQCSAISACASFNIYFERDPSTDPTEAERDPPSVANIKCVFWGGPVTTENAVNDGQWRMDFHVVIAGSNGYQSNTIVPVKGYTQANYLGNAAINAPLDCNQQDTYMGVKIWTDGPFDAGKCAAACTATSDYALAHGLGQTCQFFNTYLLNMNGAPVGQYCAMYNETWSNSYATNDGQWRGDDHYTISNSYSYSNVTDFGVCTKHT